MDVAVLIKADSWALYLTNFKAIEVGADIIGDTLANVTATPLFEAEVDVARDLVRDFLSRGCTVGFKQVS